MAEPLDRSSSTAADQGRLPKHDLSVDEQIKAHQDADKSQSWLHYGLSFVYDGGSNKSLNQLEQLKQQTDAAQKMGDQVALDRLKQQTTDAVEKDQKAVGNRDTVLGYAAGGVQLGFMAVTSGTAGKIIGWTGSAGTSALDAMKMDSSGGELLAQGFLGAGRGAAQRAIFGFSAANNWQRAAQGLAAGYTTRATDMLADTKTYGDGSLGGITKGIGSSLAQSLDVTSMAMDAGAFVGAHKLFTGVTAKFAPKLGDSIVAKGMLAGGTFGFTTGMANDFVRQTKSDDAFSLTSMLEAGLIQGGIGAIATAPGSMHAAMAPRETSNYGSGGRKPASEAALPELKLAQRLDSTSSVVSAEYRVTGGHDQLQDLIAARRLNAATPNAAMVDVRQILSDDTLGQPKRMLVQHASTAEDAEAATRFIKSNPDGIIANCDTPFQKGVSDARVLPNADQLQLHVKESGNDTTIRFTADDTTLPGYDRVGMLGEQNGHIAERALLKWILTPPDAAERDIPALRLRKQVHEELKKGEWVLFRSEVNSAADAVGQDYLLVNKKNGQYHFFDATLDSHAKSGISDFRKQGVIHIDLERDDANRVITNPTIETKERFAKMVLDAMQSHTELKHQYVPLPNYKTSPTAQHLVDSITSYGASLVKFSARLNEWSNMHEDNSDRDYYSKWSRNIDDYATDVGQAKKYAEIRARQEGDTDRPARVQALRKTISIEAKRIIRDFASGRSPLTIDASKDSYANGLSYKEQYDEAIFRDAKTGNYKFAGITTEMARLIEESLAKKPAASMEIKRWLMSESGARAVRNRTFSYLGRMETENFFQDPTQPSRGPGQSSRTYGLNNEDHRNRVGKPYQSPQEQQKNRSQQKQRWYPGVPDPNKKS